MKKFSLIGLLASIVLIASCGGGSSTTGFTPNLRVLPLLAK